MEATVRFKSISLELEGSNEPFVVSLEQLPDEKHNIIIEVFRLLQKLKD